MRVLKNIPYWVGVLGVAGAAVVFFRCGPGVDTLTSISCGGAPAWPGTFEFGKVGTSLPPLASATDCAGNVYVAGTTNGALPGFALKNPQGTDYFLVKVSSTGQKVWIFEDGPPSSTIAITPGAVAVDGLGNVYVAGTVSGSLDGQTAHANAGSKDYFLSKFDANGNRLWTAQDGPSGVNDSVAVSILPNGANDVYLVGETTASIDLQAFLSTAGAGQYDLFITRYAALDGTRGTTVEDGVISGGGRWEGVRRGGGRELRRFWPDRCFGVRLQRTA